MRGSAWRLGLGAWVALLAMACCVRVEALICPQPQPLSHRVGEGSRSALTLWSAEALASAGGSFASALWSAEASASAGGSFASALHKPLRQAEAPLPHSISLSPLAGEGDTGGGGSVCVGACCFALTPSPSPTGWERGVGAHGGAPCRCFPPRPLAGEGDIGGEGSALQIRATDYTLTRTPDGGLLLELAGKVRVEYQGRRLEGERLLLDTDAALRAQRGAVPPVRRAGRADGATRRVLLRVRRAGGSRACRRMCLASIWTPRRWRAT
jgi:hypothetical protein